MLCSSCGNHAQISLSNFCSAQFALSAKHPALSILQFVSVILLMGAVPQLLRDESSNIQLPCFLKVLVGYGEICGPSTKAGVCLISFVGFFSPVQCSFHSSQRYICHHTDCHWEACPQCQTVALHGASSWGDSGWQLLDTQWCMLQKQGENLCFLIEGCISWLFAERTVREWLHQEPCTQDGL